MEKMESLLQSAGLRDSAKGESTCSETKDQLSPDFASLTLTPPSFDLDLRGTFRQPVRRKNRPKLSVDIASVRSRKDTLDILNEDSGYSGGRSASCVHSARMATEPKFFACTTHLNVACTNQTCPMFEKKPFEWKWRKVNSKKSHRSADSGWIKFSPEDVEYLEDHACNPYCDRCLIHLNDKLVVIEFSSLGEVYVDKEVYGVEISRTSHDLENWVVYMWTDRPFKTTSDSLTSIWKHSPLQMVMKRLYWHRDVTKSHFWQIFRTEFHEKVFSDKDCNKFTRKRPFNPSVASMMKNQKFKMYWKKSSDPSQRTHCNGGPLTELSSRFSDFFQIFVKELGSQLVKFSGFEVSKFDCEKWEKVYAQTKLMLAQMPATRSVKEMLLFKPVGCDERGRRPSFSRSSRVVASDTLRKHNMTNRRRSVVTSLMPPETDMYSCQTGSVSPVHQLIGEETEGDLGSGFYMFRDLVSAVEYSDPATFVSFTHQFERQILVVQVAFNTMVVENRESVDMNASLRRVRCEQLGDTSVAVDNGESPTQFKVNVVEQMMPRFMITVCL